MYKNQRHNEILDILKEEGFASVKDLAERLYASLPTIRRDLNFLQNEGMIHRSHGGAIPADEKRKAPVSFRSGTQSKQKAKICRLAAELISSGNLIFTDASTTVMHLADYLQEEDDLTVVTNGYPICRSLSEQNIRTVSTGGRLLKDSMAFVGNTAEETASGFNADLFFFSSSALDEEGTISDYSEEETALRRVMMRRSRQTVFLCDSEKFNSRSAYRMTSLSEIDHVITDSPLPDSLLEKNGLSLVKQDDGAVWYGKK
ncbi:MAG: DeoR/GlpR transcriptional regulator [Clostridia bacterium]|nr:DeoR/GlpR transcriptional regulator [Clostridia bacterium]